VTLWSYGPALITVTGSGQHQADAVMAGIIKAMTGPGQDGGGRS